MQEPEVFWEGVIIFLFASNVSVFHIVFFIATIN
jgi:hypothetical protein